MQLATKYTLLFFSSPLTATFLLLFPTISGPGSKIWLVSGETATYGTIKVGALGICAGETCLRGLGYQPGDQLGKIVSRFPGMGVFYLITLLFLILGTITHVYFLPRLHLIRDTRLSWIMLIVPAGCSLLLLICVIINFALVAQLRNDPIFQSGLPNDGDVSPQIEATNPLSTAPSSTNAPIPFSYISDAPVSNNPPPSELLPSGIPRKLSLRALTSSTGLDASTSSTSLMAGVSAQGVSYLPIISLILSLAWLLLSIHFLRKSRHSESTREEIEQEAYKETILERKRIMQENPVDGNWGWFNFGKPAGKEAGRGGGSDAQGQGGIGLGRFAPAWITGADKDAAPSGFV